MFSLGKRAPGSTCGRPLWHYRTLTAGDNTTSSPLPITAPLKSSSAGIVAQIFRSYLKRSTVNLAVMTLAVSAVHGQAKWVGDRGAMEGELRTKAVQSSSPWVNYSIDGPTGTGQVSAKIDLRYRLWRLTGEPVWSYEPRYELGTIQLGGNSIVQDKSLEGESLIAEMAPEGSVHLRVSRELFESIRIRDLHVVARFTQLAGISDSIYHNAWVSAVFARPGEWAWDVPASPAWDQAFTTQANPLKEGEEIQQWVDDKEAKACWARLEKAWRSQQTPPLEYLRCYRMQLDLSNFWWRVEAQQPGATRPFFRRYLPGETAEQADQRNALEYQMQTLLNGVSRELATWHPGTSHPQASAKLERRLQITEQAFVLLGDNPSAHLVESLEIAKGRWAGDSLDENMRGIAESWKAEVDEVEILLTPSKLEELEHLGAAIEAGGTEISPATRRRWESLQSLKSGFRGTVVAEWTGPALPAEAQQSGMVGRIRLRQLSTSPNGRALALFVWETEYSHEEGDYGYILVDANTGEEIHRALHGRRDEDDVAIFGEAEFVARLHGDYSSNSFLLWDLLHVDSMRTLKTAWEGLYVLAWDTSRVFLMDRKNRGRIEAWDYTTGQRLWRNSDLLTTFNYASTSLIFDATREWLLARETEYNRQGAVLNASTGKLLFQWENKKYVKHEDLAQETYRLESIDPSHVTAHPQLPDGYSADHWLNRWSANGDAFLCVKPGAEVSPEEAQRGSLRYQLLK